MYCIVDRTEGGFTVCELDGKSVNIPAELIKEHVKAGDVLVHRADGFYIDKKATDENRRRILALQNSLWDC